MDLPVGPAELAKVVAGGATFLKSAKALYGVVPAGKKRGSRNPQHRQQAYLRFQQAASDVSSWTGYISTIAIAMEQRPFGWRHMKTLLTAAADMRASLTDLLGALSEIRLVGNPEPRAAAEEITAILSELMDSNPYAARGAERKRRGREQTEWQAKLGTAMKDFTLIARRDLGFAPKLRTRWWHRLLWWRSSEVEEWPGGWPGPVAKLALKQSEKPAVGR